jgi:hypothetical protein
MMNFGRRIVLILTTALATTAIGEGSASAHFSQINHYCGLSDAKMSVELIGYGPGHIRVTVNGQVRIDADFAANFFSNVDLNHRANNFYEVVVTGFDSAYDYVRTGVFCGPAVVPPVIPPAQIPEVPLTLALSLSAAVGLGGAVVLQRTSARGRPRHSTS